MCLINQFQILQHHKSLRMVYIMLANQMMRDIP